MLGLLHTEKSKNRQPLMASNNGEVIFAFDIGSSKVRLTAGQVMPDGSVNILGYKEQPSAGVRQGTVVDIAKLSQNLVTITTAFESEFGFNLSNCVIAAPGCFIESDNVNGTSTITGKNTVQEENRLEAIRSAKAGVGAFNQTDYDIIHTIVQNYQTESFSEIENPIGQYAKRLDVNVHVIGLKGVYEQNMNNVLKNLRADLNGSSFVYSGLAAADAVLTEGQMEIGVCLVDIGGGSVNVVVYENKKLVMSFGLQRGGDVITQSIAKNYGISLSVAERLKVEYGYANPEAVPEEQRGQSIRVPVGEDRTIMIRIESLADCINKQLVEIFNMVCDEISRRCRGSNSQLDLAAGFVVTGGVAKTRDLTKLYMRQGVTNSKFTIGLPRGVEVADEKLRKQFLSADKAVTIGLLRQGHCQAQENAKQMQLSKEQDTGVLGMMRRIMNWFNKEMK